MNLKCRLILEDYRKQRDSFIKLGEVAHQMLCDIADDLNLSIMTVERRVKSEKSLSGKLERKGDLYNSLDDITDILGCRIVCFLSDEIDKIGKMVEERFVIDWENVSDKRALIKEDSFGYVSLHYICSLPFGDKWPDEICGKKFEIQIKTVLQHAWSVINHDIGYKSDFGVPRDIRRQFARLAGLLEIADDEFVRARDNMVEYTDNIRERIAADDADEVIINTISLTEYVQKNPKMRSLIKEIADICGAEINFIDPESYIPQLSFLGMKRLGDIDEMISRNYELAMRLASHALSNTGMDIVSSSVALRFLCRAELLNKDYGFDEITEFLNISLGDRTKAERQARHLLRQKSCLCQRHSDRVQRALEFATEKHGGQKRIGGDDYITHPIAVYEAVKAKGLGEDCQIAALFHDLLEDTDATEDELLKLSSAETLIAVKLLTKADGYDMAEYISGIKSNEIAFAVKSADRLHNLQCALVASNEFKRKYILETVDWYLDFSPEIKEAVKTLAKSLDAPMPELSFLYDGTEAWKI